MKFLTRYGNNLKERFLFTLFSKYYPCININRGKSDTMKYLNVAEKNDAAKNIALHLSRGTSRRREGLSRFNKIYEFDGEVNGQKCQMVMTSVSGHLLALEFVGAYKGWQSCDPLTLFTAPVFKYCPKDYENIKKTLEREIRSCQGLIIWTDCDREGENIGFEIIEVCTAVKNNLRIYRAKFSEITAVSVRRALQTLEQPDKYVSDAVDVRQELDLRIGAAFTRFQTLRLQKVFPSKLADSLVSYGSCQFPTLGFVVERYRAVENFIAEPFWKIKVNHTMNNLSVDFSWERVRLFDQGACQVLHDICMESPQAKVCDVKTKPKSKWRPLPLDTVELEKLASRKLKINAKETMRLAERLYTQGFISYPRTETNEYPKEMNLGQLVGLQTGDPQWGPFAQGILDSGGPTPRQGNKSDKAHPPIHPTKYANSLSGNEQRLYEFIVRSFLACCSKDAQGQETTATIDVAGERFAASGLMITARNYLDVYPYDKWSSKEIHVYQTGETFNPTSIDLVDGSTSPPSLLTEADLIALMEKHGIGTDATHAEHIETIKKRCYVDVVDTRFVPGLLGMGLVEGYDALRLRLARPDLRARLEADLKDISLGNKMPQVVLAEQIEIYKSVYQTVTAEPTKIDTALAARFNERPNEYTPVTNSTQNLPSVLKCPKCGADMVVRQKKNNADELYISCMSFPSCKNAVWLPPLVKTLSVANDACPTCGPNYKRVTFEWRNNSISHMFPPPYTSCIGGCDQTLLEYLRINLSSVRNTPESRTQVDNRPRDTSNITNVTRDVLPPRQNSIPNPPRQFVPPVVVNRDQNPTNNSRMPPPRNMPVPAQDDSNVMCKCNLAAILLTVRKQNENFGKKFYKCAQGKDNGGCDFFLWSPENSDVPPAQTAHTSSWGTGSDVQSSSSSRNSQRPSSSTSGYNSDSVTGNDDDVQCNCGLPAKRVIAQKEGPNKGRAFYGCSKDFSSRCNFFQWADTGPQPTTEWNSDNFRVRDRGRDGRGAGGRGRGARGGPRGASGPRKCTLCRQEGHTRNRCPNIDSNL